MDRAASIQVESCVQARQRNLLEDGRVRRVSENSGPYGSGQTIDQAGNGAVKRGGTPGVWIGQLAYKWNHVCRRGSATFWRTEE
jgi:hypothetical protein